MDTSGAMDVATVDRQAALRSVEEARLLATVDEQVDGSDRPRDDVPGRLLVLEVQRASATA